MNGNVEQITGFFTGIFERLNAYGANLNNEVDILFKGLKAVPCKEFHSYIHRKEEQYTDGTLTLNTCELIIVAQQQ